MTKLDCTATKCVYNQDRLCSKGDICVDGREATTANATCCASFVEKRGDSMSNACGKGKREIQIDCKATKCQYNDDCKCTAGQIGIGGSNACDCKETECMTFSCK